MNQYPYINYLNDPSFLDMDRFLFFQLLLMLLMLVENQILSFKRINKGFQSND